MLRDDEVQNLIEVAYSGMGYKMFDEAGRIFEALTLVCPLNPHPRIGTATLLYMQRQPVEAIDLLKGVLSDFPKALFSRALLARILKETGQPEWETYAQEVLRMDDQNTIATVMVNELLGLVPPGQAAKGATSVPKSESSSRPATTMSSASALMRSARRA